MEDEKRKGGNLISHFILNDQLRIVTVIGSDYPGKRITDQLNVSTKTDTMEFLPPDN